MVEDIPLSADFEHSAVGVSARCGCLDDLAIRVDRASAAVDDGSAVCERSQRGVRPCVCQGIVGRRKSELSFLCPAAVYEHILVLDLTHGRCLEETEYPLLVSG